MTAEMQTTPKRALCHQINAVEVKNTSVKYLINSTARRLGDGLHLSHAQSRANDWPYMSLIGLTASELLK